MFRTAVMMAASLALTGAVVAHAYYLKHQFYPTVVYLTKSSPSMAVSSGLREGRRSLLSVSVELLTVGVLVPLTLSPALGTLSLLLGWLTSPDIRVHA